MEEYTTGSLLHATLGADWYKEVGIGVPKIQNLLKRALFRRVSLRRGNSMHNLARKNTAHLLNLGMIGEGG